MRNLVFRPMAEDDLSALYRYIARTSGHPGTAIRYVRRIRVALETLLTFPESGRSRDDLRPGLRILGFERRVVIAYTILSCGDIEIGRVFYGGRDYEALLRAEGDG